MITWLFPGQGSQHKGMGEDLFKEFSELVAQANDILGYSIQELCLNNPEEKLNQTLYTQPAVYTINALSFFRKTGQGAALPDFVAGHSLGEYNALLAAATFDFVTGLRLVKKRAELLSQTSQTVDGTMAAIINLRVDELQTVLTNNGLDKIDIANLNAPLQTVISGIRSDIVQAVKILETLKDVYCPILQVSGAFHSRYMSEAQQKFASFIEGIEFNEPKIPVISNATAKPYEQSEIAANLTAQITHRVNWVKSIQYLLQQGDMLFEEVGPGNVLTKLIPKIKMDTKPVVTKEISHSENDATILLKSLGSQDFTRDYGIKYAYVTGGMARGIASVALVVKMGRAGLMGYFGTAGLTLSKIEEEIQHIQRALRFGEAYGMNFLHTPSNPQHELNMVELFLKYNVQHIEAAGFMQITPALVKYRVKGLQRNALGKIISPQKIMAKLSRPEIVEIFLSPPPQKMVHKLLETKQISSTEAKLSQHISMADDLCVESDSAGQTDMGVMAVLLPTVIRQRDELAKQYSYSKQVRVGAAGGIGTPEAASAAFILGADFILTGSINQCTVEAGTSDITKDILQQLNVQDTIYAPAGDLFELGAKNQVVRQGVFFPARANKLYDLYQHCDSLDEIDEKTKTQIQEKYFHRSFEEVYAEVKTYYATWMPEMIEKAERVPKVKMALIFKWYFAHSMNLAVQGDIKYKVDYQIYCGPAMGAFNQWVKGTSLKDWRNRHVDAIAEKMIQETAVIFNQQYAAMYGYKPEKI